MDENEWNSAWLVRWDEQNLLKNKIFEILIEFTSKGPVSLIFFPRYEQFESFKLVFTHEKDLVEKFVKTSNRNS